MRSVSCCRVCIQKESFYFRGFFLWGSNFMFGQMFCRSWIIFIHLSKVYLKFCQFPFPKFIIRINNVNDQHYHQQCLSLEKSLQVDKTCKTTGDVLAYLQLFLSLNIIYMFAYITNFWMILLNNVHAYFWTL